MVKDLVDSYKEEVSSKAASKVLRWLDIGLVALVLVAYVVYLNNRHGELRLELAGVGLLVLVTGVARFYLTYPAIFKIAKFAAWTQRNWPQLMVVLALLVGGWFGWQAIRHAPSLTQAETQLAGDAVNIIKRSDWTTPRFGQPPLYLNLNATVDELGYLQQLNGGPYGSLDALRPISFIDLSRLVNLILGLLTVIPVYAAAARLYTKRAGAMAGLLLALAWTHYSLYAQLQPQTLAAFLLACAFYFAVCAYQNQTKHWDFLWAGLLAGLATAAAYGAIWLLVVLLLSWAGSRKRESLQLLQIFGGWLAGFTIGAAGWILNLPRFVNGLGSIGSSGDIIGSAKFYFKDFWRQDAGLLLILLIAFGLAIVRPRLQAWLALSFVLFYVVTLVSIGPNQYLRFALAMPFVALAAARPLDLAAQFLQTRLNDGKHSWAGAATIGGLTLALILISVLVRRQIGL